MTDNQADEASADIRLDRSGGTLLADAELLAILLRSGARPARGAAIERLLAAHHLADLATAPVASLVEAGLTTDRARRLVAGFELGRRVYRPEANASLVRDARDVYALTRDLELARREYFVCLLLDVRNRVLRRDTISIGSLSASIVHPREVFRCAVEHGAANLVLVHNHPSGNPDPSREDIALTQRLVAAGAVMGIEVLDHVVIGRGSFVSFKSRSLL